jgi:uncharacterized protein with HEPN domain
MKKADAVYLKHIRDAISRIEEYTKAVGYDYFGVDLDAVWDTVKKDVPVLKKHVKKILNEE